MDPSTVLGKLAQVHREGIQDDCGYDPAAVTPDCCPLDDLQGFDSVLIPPRSRVGSPGCSETRFPKAPRLKTSTFPRTGSAGAPSRKLPKLYCRTYGTENKKWTPQPDPRKQVIARRIRGKPRRGDGGAFPGAGSKDRSSCTPARDLGGGSGEPQRHRKRNSRGWPEIYKVSLSWLRGRVGLIRRIRTTTGCSSPPAELNKLKPDDLRNGFSPSWHDNAEPRG